MRRKLPNRNKPFELWCEGLLVEQDPWVVVFAVEAILHRLHALYHTLYVAISSQQYESCVCAASWRSSVLCQCLWYIDRHRALMVMDINGYVLCKLEVVSHIR